MTLRPTLAQAIADDRRRLRRTLPFVAVLADKVARVHGPRAARLAPLAEAVHELAEAVDGWLDAEDAASRRADDARADRAAVARGLDVVRALADGFVVPAWGCATWRMLASQLAEVERVAVRVVDLEERASAVDA